MNQFFESDQASGLAAERATVRYVFCGQTSVRATGLSDIRKGWHHRRAFLLSAVPRGALGLRFDVGDGLRPICCGA